MRNTTCKNCGGDEAIHHYETMQCPFGGYEAYNGKQRWMDTHFDNSPDYKAELAAMRERVAELEKFVGEWEARFGFLAQENAPTSVEAIDEVACVLNMGELARLRSENERLRNQLVALAAAANRALGEIGD